MQDTADGTNRMDEMYRYQRYFYDVTRKAYLLGRDHMIASLNVPVGGSVLEVGCGTARNLIRAASSFPGATCFGFDLSEQMLTTARTNVGKNGLRDRIVLEQADATQFDPAETFGWDGFDRVFVAYSLCIIPGWEKALDRSFRAVKPGGSLHLVDFGEQERLPRLFRSALRAWLRQFGVFPQHDMEAELRRLLHGQYSDFKFESVYRGYAYHAVILRNK
ncbi:MAG: class I SAM-dependent methyltransferase [Filomicrobium sp.]